ncbi:hypothetical protein CRG49_003345 [Neisseria sp. N95_16]|uniref:HpaII family restriction endonuclease n=1 Tax=Neisseria brasiliensis TaxID=2666100 RepID=A0A7X2H037_9NEIS|nr:MULTISPECIES: HpaII family restriction endonuclease [Neisseria]MRN39103.1 HpaII family restriction endonuclease [Neisseria brasiliensis]PJO10200.1 hypothetical protein CRG49_003345 [Neisseria sp. N95_16]
MSISFEFLRRVNEDTVQIPFSENFLGRNYEYDKSKQTVLISHKVLIFGSKTANFLYEVEGCNDEITDNFNSLLNSRGKKDFRRRMSLLDSKNCRLSFKQTDNIIFAKGLRKQNHQKT